MLKKLLVLGIIGIALTACGSNNPTPKCTSFDYACSSAWNRYYMKMAADRDYPEWTTVHSNGTWVWACKAADDKDEHCTKGWYPKDLSDAVMQRRLDVIANHS